MTKLLDPYARTIDYLRISITDRCNLNCIYCTIHNFDMYLQTHQLDLDFYNELFNTGS